MSNRKCCIIQCNYNKQFICGDPDSNPIGIGELGCNDPIKLPEITYSNIIYNGYLSEFSSEFESELLQNKSIQSPSLSIRKKFTDVNILLIPGVLRQKIETKFPADCTSIYREIFNYHPFNRKSMNGPHVYIMLNSDSNHFKIGNSKNPAHRERTLQAQEPCIHLIKFWPAHISIEKELHSIYKSKRIRGEWFDLSLTDLMDIRDFMKNNYPTC
jgi:hypothetical protein